MARDRWPEEGVGDDTPVFLGEEEKEPVFLFVEADPGNPNRAAQGVTEIVVTERSSFRLALCISTQGRPCVAEIVIGVQYLIAKELVSRAAEFLLPDRVMTFTCPPPLRPASAG